MPAKPEAMPVANGLMVDPRVPMPHPSRTTAAPVERVVAGGDHHRDHQGVEGEALLGHPVRGPADGEHRHQERDEQAFLAPEPRHQAADACLDRPGLHGDAEEATDHDDEQGDVDGAEQRPAVVVVDVPGLVLDAVEAVDRGGQRVDDDPLRVRLDLVVGARYGLPFLGQVVGARRHQPGGDGGEHDEGEQDGVGGREGEAALLLRPRSRSRRRLIRHRYLQLGCRSSSRVGSRRHPGRLAGAGASAP